MVHFETVLHSTFHVQHLASLFQRLRFLPVIFADTVITLFYNSLCHSGTADNLSCKSSVVLVPFIAYTEIYSVMTSNLLKNAVFWDVAPPAHTGSSLADFSTLKMKGWFTIDLHGATSQKTAFFIVTAVKTSNLISNLLLT
jgi:hypothetical protein